MLQLARQLREAVQAFAVCRTPPALIGGLALAAHQVIRATQDIDFLIDAADAELVHSLLTDLGYRCIHRSADAANYRRGGEGLDLLYAHRPIAQRLLAAAIARESPMGELRVLSVEGLIAFKLQALVNDPTRLHDLDDIRALLRAAWLTLNRDEVSEYFRLFDREEQWDALVAEVESLR